MLEQASLNLLYKNIEYWKPFLNPSQFKAIQNLLDFIKSKVFTLDSTKNIGRVSLP